MNHLTAAHRIRTHEAPSVLVTSIPLHIDSDIDMDIDIDRHGYRLPIDSEPAGNMLESCRLLAQLLKKFLLRACPAQPG
jgi:hypothetical protein